MISFFRRKYSFFLFILTLHLIIGCQSNIIPSSTSIASQEKTQIIQSTVLVQISTPSPEDTYLLPSITPSSPTIQVLPTSPSATIEKHVPTLSPDDALERVLGLLRGNGGCKLPCWWGLTPGRTTWREAYNSLIPFAREFMYIDSSPEQPSFIGWFQFATSEDKTSSVYQTHTIENGIVEVIEVGFGDIYPYELADFLNENGQPEEVWTRTFGTEYNGKIPFYLALFYPTQGILAILDSNDATLRGDKVRKCFIDDPILELVLWSPERKYTYQEATTYSGFIKYDDGFPLLPLEKATGMDVFSFYEKFKEKGKTNCLESPAELWPGQYE